LRRPHLAPALHSITSRVLLSMLLVLPQMLPASLSPDSTLHGRVLAKVHELCTELGTGTTNIMSKSLGFVIRVGIIDGSEHTLISNEDVHQRLNLMLHPRVPPLVRSLPHVESLSLFRAEESLDEIDTRGALGLEFAEPNVPNFEDDIVTLSSLPKPMATQPSQTPNVVAKQADALSRTQPLTHPAPQAKVVEPISTSTLPLQLDPFPSLPDPLPSKQISMTTDSTISVAVQPAQLI